MVEYLSPISGGCQLKVIVEQLSRDNATNSSQVKFQVVLSAINSSYHSPESLITLRVDGQEYSWREGSHSLSQGHSSVMLTQTITVKHLDNGLKNLPVSATFRVLQTGSLTLTISEQSLALSRTSKPSSLNIGRGVIGSALSVNINRMHDGLTHTIRYKWFSKSGTIATNVATSHSWTIPLTFAQDIPNTATGTGTLYLDTFNGSEKVGTQEVAFVAVVPDTMRPTFTGITLADGHRTVRGLLTGNNFLQGLSDIQVTFNGAAGSYGSAIAGYKAEIVNRGQVTTSNGGSLGPMKFNGSATIRASVFDGRGRQSATRDVTINVIEYFAPVWSFSAVRTRSNPNIVQVLRTAKIAPVTFGGSQKNTMTLSFRVAPVGSTSFTADTGGASASYTTVSELIGSAANLGGNYAANRSYTIIGTLADRFTSVEFSASVSTESVVMSYDKDGRVGVGKPVEFGKPGSLDVAGDIYAGSKLIQMHALTTGDPVRGYGKFSVDANTTYDTGFYWTSVNIPGGDWGCLEVYRFSDKEVQQIFRQRNGSRSWSRYRHNQTGVWTAWVVVGLDQFYPVGTIFSSTVNASPQGGLGGTWQSLGQTTQNGNTIYSWKRTS